jgi:hypothetical protein
MKSKTYFYLAALCIVPFCLAFLMLSQTHAAGLGVAPTDTTQPVATYTPAKVSSGATSTGTDISAAVDSTKSGPVGGIAAINVGGKKAALTTNSNGAKFTEADVRQFFTTHPEWGLIKSSIPFTIEKVEFLTSREVSAKLGRNVTAIVGVTDTTLFCLVTGHGSFSMAGGPPTNAQSSQKGVTFQRAFQLFDAQTGNLVLMGGLDK